MVGSSPLTGDAVTVTVIPAGTDSATACSVPLAGITSNRGGESKPCSNSVTPPTITRPPSRASPPLAVPRRARQYSGRRLRNQRGERRLQPGDPGVDPGQRQAEHPRHPLRLRRQRRGRVLGQPDQPPVVPEVVRPQLRVPVQAQLGQHQPVEAAQQEVGQHVGARLGLEQRGHPGRPGEHVVAVQPGQPAQPVPGAQLIQGAVGAAVGVGHGDGAAGVQGTHHVPFRQNNDLLRPVVQDRGQGPYGDRPAAARHDLPDVPGQRPAGEDVNVPGSVSWGALRSPRP